MESLILEIWFLIFASFFFLYSVFFEQENEEYESAELVIRISIVVYTCLFLYLTDFSILEVLTLTIFVLSYPVSYFYTKNNYPKIKLEDKNKED